MANQINLQSVLDGRLQTYKLLARLYRKEIDEDTLQGLLKMRCPINTGNADVDTGYKLLHRYLSGTWERTLEDLQRDYLRTFIGANTTGHSAAYPNESVHTSPDRLVMQDARDEILAIYRSANLQSESGWSQGEDHIALELEYMQICTMRAIEALGKGDMTQASAQMMRQYNFLTDHLQAWVPYLVNDMLKFAETDFYKGLAYLTRGFIDVDKEFLENILSEELDVARGLSAEE